jgi:predicted nucleotidyltransferase
MGEATTKRLAIVKGLAGKIAQFSEGIMLCGDVALGTATDASPIDLVVAVKKGGTPSVVKALNFQRHLSGRAIDLIEKYDLGCAWSSDAIEGIETNCFLYNPKKLAEYVTLKKPLSIWRPDKPNNDAPAYGFDGKDVRLSREVMEMWGGYVYNVPSLAKDKFYTTPIRENMLGTGGIIVQNDSFLSKLEQDAWSATVQQLIKEHGADVDLRKYNVLNTIYAYHQKRLPENLAKDIQRHTNRELNAIVMCPKVAQQP